MIKPQHILFVSHFHCHCLREIFALIREPLLCSHTVHNKAQVLTFKKLALFKNEFKLNVRFSVVEYIFRNKE